MFGFMAGFNHYRRVSWSAGELHYSVINTMASRTSSRPPTVVC